LLDWDLGNGLMRELVELGAVRPWGDAVKLTEAKNDHASQRSFVGLGCVGEIVVDVLKLAHVRQLGALGCE
jgi:hypothetical protein